VKKALGKGLDALLPSPVRATESEIIELAINKIEPNPEQPRQNFDGEAIRQLTESIRSVGVVQPIIVTDEGSYYRIVAGERRWRAAKAAGLTSVPAIVRRYTRERGIEIALIENLQRQDLNPIEEAGGYDRLIREYGYTQEQIASSVGKSRPAVANAIRLLRHTAYIRDMLAGGAISAGHARTLLMIGDEARRDEIAGIIVDRDLNVRQAEALVNREIASANPDGESDRSGASPGEALSPDVERKHALNMIADDLRAHFNTRVSIDDARGKTGKIVIEYYGDEDLQRLLDVFGIKTGSGRR